LVGGKIEKRKIGKAGERKRLRLFVVSIATRKKEGFAVDGKKE